MSGDRSQYVQDRTYVPIDTAEIEAAEKVILRAVQTQAFPHEVKVLQRLSKADFTDRTTARHRNDAMKKGSKLYRLDPYFTEDGLVRAHKKGQPT